MQISRRFTDQSFGVSPSIDDKISVFEDRVLGWQLEVAELIREQIENAPTGSPWQHAAFGLLNSLVSYFEMIAQYRSGQSSSGKSGQFFQDGLEDVFPRQFSVAEKKAIYSAVRCGLYHNAMTKRGVVLSGDFPNAVNATLDANGDIIALINPHRLSPVLVNHFNDYVVELRKPTNTALRSSFETFFDQHG